jgi:prepilin-type N-terminal cleavage/methylation domain-containing protein
MRRNGQEAFTLLELLVALGLGVVVIGAAYAALSASIDSSHRLDGYVEGTTTLSSVASTMKRQLTNAYFESTSTLSPVFTVTPSDQSAAASQAGQPPSDTISFSYAWSGTMVDAETQFPYYTVTYFIADATTDSPGGLTREITPLWQRDVTDTPQDELIAPEVRGMGVLCYDGTQWTNQWDAASSGLPCVVRVDLYVDDSRFKADPWRMDAPTAAQGALEPYHIVAWLGKTVAATTTLTTTTPATGASTGAGGASAAGR